MASASSPSVTRFSRMFSAIATEPRLRILQLLITAEPQGLVVGEIQAELAIPNSTLSHHLDKLKHEGLVSVRRDSTYLWYRADLSALKELLGFLFAECCTRNRVIAPADIISITSSGESLTHLEKPMTSDLRSVVKVKYGEAATRASAGQGSACCGAGPASLEGCDPITSNLYPATEAQSVPEAALRASLGCGNPTALAKLQPGETVLDLGSGGGIDVLLSARRVGPTGKAFGLDMTDEMLALAEENKRKSGLSNVEFLKGEIENIPLPDNTVDVIVSNCVINLSGDKDRVLREAFRVLKPGGRFAISDVVVRGEVPAEIRKSIELWVGCVAGALSDSEYRHKLDQAGFQSIEIEATRVYNIEDAREFLRASGIDAEAIAPQVQDKFISAFVRATKPAAPAACCGPTCCA